MLLMFEILHKEFAALGFFPPAVPPETQTWRPTMVDRERFCGFFQYILALSGYPVTLYSIYLKIVLFLEMYIYIYTYIYILLMNCCFLLLSLRCCMSMKTTKRRWRTILRRSLFRTCVGGEGEGFSRRLFLYSSFGFGTEVVYRFGLDGRAFARRHWIIHAKKTKNKQTNKQRNKQTNKQTNQPTNERTYVRTYIHTYIHTYTHMYICIYMF